MALTKKQMCCYVVLVVLFCVFAAKQTFALVGGQLGKLVPACGVEPSGCPKPCLLLVHGLLRACCFALAACNKVEGYMRVRVLRSVTPRRRRLRSVTLSRVRRRNVPEAWCVAPS